MAGHESTNRRDFLQAGVAGVAAIGMAGALPDTSQNPPRNEGNIPLRPLGKTGQNVTLLGLGGFHAAVHKNEAESVALIQRAIDEGITFLDNCWDYHEGAAEERMGKAISQGGRRDKVFLMTKVCGRDARTAQTHLEDSLRRLKTDHLDLWQFHEIVYDNDPDWIFAAGGAIETALKAKEQGKVRYLGFTGHKDPAIHLKMLARFQDWDTVQLPLNVLDSQFRSFQHNVLPKLIEQKIAPIGMKSLAGDGSVVTKAKVKPADALRYVMSLPIATLISGIDSVKVLEQNLEIVRNFSPLSAEERSRIEQSVSEVAGDGRHELFKTTKVYDGVYHRQQHGFSTDAKAT